jgi:hypothetical protein
MATKIIPMSQSLIGSKEQKQHPIKSRLNQMGGRRAGYTLIWLANQSGCSPDTITNFIHNGTRMKLATYQKMLKTLNVGDNYIYGVSSVSKQKEA